MPRTLNATLSAAMDSGAFQMYARIVARRGATEIESAIPVAFKLSGINMKAKWEKQDASIFSSVTYFHEIEFKLTRGVTVAGVNYTIDSSWYFGTGGKWDGIFMEIEACMLPSTKYTRVLTNNTYQDVLVELLDSYDKITVMKNIGSAWQSYQFFPDNKTLQLNRASDIIKILRQKFLIEACDAGDDKIMFSAIGTESTVTINHTLALGLIKDRLGSINARRFVYRDEANTVHYSGDLTEAPLWNLGYLESTASPPSNFQSYSFSIKPIAPHLKYLTFDRFTFTIANYPNMDGGSITTPYMRVEEEFDIDFAELAWRINISSFDWAQGTEGGALPGTIEAAAPYTPLNVSMFDGILDENDNNIQAAMEKLDDHEHEPEVTQAELDAVQAAIDAHIADTTNVHAFSSLSGLPAAETNANDIFRVDSPGGPSLWTGTINGAPSGAAVTVSAPVTGTEAVLVPTSTSQLAKMRLYNLTRGNSALISNYNTGTNVITLTANAPGTWANGDSLTIASQTVSGGGYSWVDLEITSGPTGKTSMFVNLYLLNATANQEVHMHPFETYAASKLYSFLSQVTNILAGGLTLQKITGNVVSLAWTGTPTRIVVREAGYLK